MQIVIDPWVLDGTLYDEECARKLARLEQDKAEFCFIITETLKENYAVFLDNRSSRKNTQLAITFAQRLVDRTGLKHTFLVPKSLPLESVGQDCNCRTEDLDRHLLAIVVDRCKAKTRSVFGPAVILLLYCASGDNCGATKGRCLRSEKCRSSLQQRHSDLKIICTEDRKSSIEILDPRNVMNNQQHDARFEDECALWLQRKYGGNVERGVEKWGSQIDVLLLKDKIVYVGECKLVHGENAYQSQEKALLQLEERICSGSKHMVSYHWKGLVFCNKLFDQEIINKANDVKQRMRGIDVEFVFVRVDMPKGWENKPDWRLSDNNFKY